MSAERPLRVVLCWHMHQPHYFDASRGEYRQPWTYLHAIKDYVDMAAHLEAEPAARAVVNFAPVLLDQIADYAQQVAASLAHGTPIHDPLLQALAEPAPADDPHEQARLIESCLRANATRVIDRFPIYRELTELARWLDDHAPLAAYVDRSRFVTDLVVWYHLAWLGETVRESDPRVRMLTDKGRHFTAHDRRVLLELVGGLLASIVPRYRSLAADGRVELSCTPYAHPILPLLLDPGCAREAVPEITLPSFTDYPDGAGRARWHLREGIAAFERHFDFRPTGCWPAEGGISAPALALIEEAGFRWAASGETVLRNSLALPVEHHADPRKPWLHRPYTVGNGRLRCFFRDDGLSDLIGFTYADWHAVDAVGNLIHHLENIAAYCDDRDASVVSIILDGENAWEYYPENGIHFFRELYRRLVEHPGIALTTFAEVCGGPAVPLANVVSGSWVYGTFTTWIGDPDKNRGWEMLVAAKRTFDAAVDGLDAPTRAAAERQLGLCEGSDWFWWFGDYNPASAVRDFDQLFRVQLATLYQLLGVEPPEVLAHPFASGHGDPGRGGVMRRGQAV